MSEYLRRSRTYSAPDRAVDKLNAVLAERGLSISELKMSERFETDTLLGRITVKVKNNTPRHRANWKRVCFRLQLKYTLCDSWGEGVPYAVAYSVQGTHDNLRALIHDEPRLADTILEWNAIEAAVPGNRSKSKYNPVPMDRDVRRKLAKQQAMLGDKAVKDACVIPTENPLAVHPTSYARIVSKAIGAVAAAK